MNQKDHVTLTTEIMAAESSTLQQQQYITVQYIYIENNYFEQ